MELPDLKPQDLKVLFAMHSLCYKGKSENRYRKITTNYVAINLNISYKKCRGSMEKLVKLGYFNKTTTSFLEQHSKKKLWTKCSYYRIGEKIKTLT